MFKLVFLFTGLCGFVPGPTTFDVLLPQSAAHSSVLVVKAGEVLEAPSKLRPVSFCNHRAFPLNDHLIRVKDATAGPVVLTSAAAPVGTCPKDEAELASYSWVAPMDRIVPGYNKVRSDLHTTPTGAASLAITAALAAKVRLTNGTVSTRSVARNETEMIRWVFHKDTAEEFKTALADLVEFRGNDDLSEVTLEFVSLNDGTVVDTMVLADTDHSQEVVVEIRNQPPDRICSTDTEIAPTGPHEYHFADLFHLLEGDPPAILPAVDGDCEERVQDPPMDTCQVPCSFAGRVGMAIRDLFGIRTYSNPQCPGADLDPP